MFTALFGWCLKARHQSPQTGANEVANNPNERKSQE